MAVYNGRPFLREAVDGILGQTFPDFEFIVIDDASTDGTAELMAEYAARDRRISVLRNDANIGQSRSLNRGLDVARGEYVARTDADDVALPQRFERQIAFLERHGDVGILGSGSWLIDTKGVPRGGSSLMPLDDLQIRWSTMFQNPIHHPTVMLRRDVLERHHLRYDDAWRAQDYDLWVRMLRHTRAANLPVRLMKYRVHGANFTSRHFEVVRRETADIALRAVRDHLPGFAVAPERLSQLVALCSNWSAPPLTSSQRARLVAMLFDLLAAFTQAHAGSPGLDALRRYAALRIARVVFRGAPRPQWPGALLRLLRLDPVLPWHALRHVRSSRRNFAGEPAERQGPLRECSRRL
jgi:glycosyltransferase involved in cell wall biosynthesis